MNTIFYAQSRTKPFGGNAEECVTCLNLLDRFCRGANMNAPSLVLAFLSLGMQPPRKQRKDHTQLLRLPMLLSIWMKAADFSVIKQKKKKKGWDWVHEIGIFKNCHYLSSLKGHRVCVTLTVGPMDRWNLAISIKKEEMKGRATYIALLPALFQ